MKFLVGLMIGLGLGVLVGFLFAPQSGETTRAQIGEQGELLRSGQLNEQIRTRFQDAVSQGQDLYNRTKNDLSERYSRAKAGQL